jgi:hypothetical protein
VLIPKTLSLDPDKVLRAEKLSLFGEFVVGESGPITVPLVA